MGPHRIIHNRKGYRTETVFDAARGIFTERPFPPPPAPPHNAAATVGAGLPDAMAWPERHPDRGGIARKP